MTRRAQIERYVEATIDLDRLKRQLVRFPELKAKLAWEREYTMAMSRAHEYYRCLRGSDLGEANRRLAQRRAGHDPLPA